MLQVVLCVFARNWCLFLAGQYPSEFYVACCVGGICKQLFVSSRLIPIKRLCCMLRCGCLQEIDVGIKPVNTHLNSMLHVVLWVFARNSWLSLAGQYPSEFYVACCVVGICQEYLCASSRSKLIRMLCCMLCCGYLQEIAVCLQLVNTHPNSMLHVVLWVFVRNICVLLAGQNSSECYVAWCAVGICKQLFVSSRSIPIRKFCAACCVVGICKKQLFVSSRSIPIRILCCMLCCGYLQAIAVCFQLVKTHPNSMLHVVLLLLAKSCLFLAGHSPSEFYVACCAVGYVACCVVGICKQLFVSCRSIPIRSLCCMLCCGHLQIAVCFQLVNTHLISMLHVVLWVPARHSYLFLAGQYPSECYVACCVVGICKQLFASRFQPVNTHPSSMLHVVQWVFARNCCWFQACQYPSEFYVARCVGGICKKWLFVSSRSRPIRILCCMLCCGKMSGISVCLQPVNTHSNSMLHVVLWVFAKKQMIFSNWSIPIRILCCMLCCWHFPKLTFSFQPVNTHPNSMLHVVLLTFPKIDFFFLAGQYPSGCYVACCVVGICEQLFVCSRSMPIRILCCMLCCGYLQEIAVCFQPVNTSEFYVACCVVGICKQLFVSSRSIHPKSLLHVVL